MSGDDASARERIAYEELRPGDVIEPGDEWQNEDGRWRPFASLDGSCVMVRHTQRARRPHRVSMMLAAFANQAEVLAEVRADEKRLCDQLNLLRSECVKVLVERDEARAEIQPLLKAITDNADQFAEHAKGLARERDEARAEATRLQIVVNNLYREPTARRVQNMLRIWATELEWSAECFRSINREEIDTIQRTLIAVMERIETMMNPEGDTDGE